MFIPIAFSVSPPFWRFKQVKRNLISFLDIFPISHTFVVVIKPVESFLASLLSLIYSSLTYQLEQCK